MIIILVNLMKFKCVFELYTVALPGTFVLFYFFVLVCILLTLLCVGLGLDTGGLIGLGLRRRRFTVSFLVLALAGACGHPR